MPSLQLGGWHCPDRHSARSQSASISQPWLWSQRRQPLLPPQSASVSSRFCTPSSQPCSSQIPDTQWSLAQSELSVQLEPSSQAWLQGSPQARGSDVVLTPVHSSDTSCRTVKSGKLQAPRQTESRTDQRIETTKYRTDRVDLLFVRP